MAPMDLLTFDDEDRSRVTAQSTGIRSNGAACVIRSATVGSERDAQDATAWDPHRSAGAIWHDVRDLGGKSRVSQIGRLAFQDQPSTLGHPKRRGGPDRCGEAFSFA